MKYIHTLLMGAAVFFILNGCSSTTDSIRYKKDKRETKQTKESDTFTKSDSLYIDQFGFPEEDEEEFEDYTEETSKIDVEGVLQKFTKEISGLDADKGTLSEQVLIEIIKLIKTPYKYGGTTEKGIDCSAFTQRVYGNALKIQLLRSARDQYTMGEVVSNREDLKFGDLVFFDTRRRARPGHVGIYLGDNFFVHASSKLGVTVSSLNQDYYNKKYMGGRRMQESIIEK